MKFGNIEINEKFVLAPIAGYTDSPFRIIARRFGAGFVVSELVSAEGIKRRNEKTFSLMRFSEEERPFGIQIFGNDPGVMAEAAQIVEDLGVDFVDINLGCPARKVCAAGEGGGAALLRDPVLVERITSEVVKKVGVPVTAKIRTGWDEKSKNYHEIVDVLQNAGISLISVHGRTRSQKYTGEADWNIIKEIAGIASVPVIGNGDVLSYDEACMRLDTSGCDAVMIGRGALGNPWIFSGDKPGIDDIISLAKEHLSLMIEHYGEHAVVLMRKHMSKYFHGLRGASKLRAGLVRAKTESEMLELLELIDTE